MIMSGKEFIKTLNDAKILQSFYFDDGICEGGLSEELLSEWIKQDPRLLEDGLNVDKHRWYEITTSYYKLIDGTIMGVNLVSQLYSESMSWEDAYHTLRFFEGEEVKIVTYQPKTT